MDGSVSSDIIKSIEKAFRGRYECLERLGSGGMGNVFLARQRGQGDMLYALKIVDRKSPESRGIRIYDELRILKDLDHPNIVRVYEAVKDKDHVYMVQEYISGRTLAELRDDPKRPALRDDDVRRWMREIAGALTYLHSKGVIHRDIKPGNIMIDRSGRAVLIDFGIARRVSSLRLSLPGVTTGSAPYSPLERLQGRPDSAATDIYAYGATFYSLLSGNVPRVSGCEINALRTDGQSIEPYYMDAYRSMISGMESIKDGDMRTLIRDCVDIDPQKRVDGFMIP